jgi:outer membrane lipoprotein carrier protein
MASRKSIRRRLKSYGGTDEKAQSQITLADEQFSWLATQHSSTRWDFKHSFGEENMNFKFLIALCLIFNFTSQSVFSQDSTPATDSKTPKLQLSLDKIIEGVEKIYDVPGFSAQFVQESTIKAMELTDVASGKIFVKRPGMMRWVYEKPYKQIIITNGKKLWIYKPEDNQVMLGKAPAFFGDGKGAGFLADIKILRFKFNITLPEQKDSRYFKLKLVPIEKTIELAEIFLSVSRSTFKVSKIVTYNSYGDENQIDLINSRFDILPAEDLFTFSIPEGVDVLEFE